jgi:hypothetical protein
MLLLLHQLLDRDLEVAEEQHQTALGAHLMVLDSLLDLQVGATMTVSCPGVVWFSRYDVLGQLGIALSRSSNWRVAPLSGLSPDAKLTDLKLQ